MSLEKIVSKVEADSKAAEKAILQEAAKHRNGQIAAARKQREDILADFARKAELAVTQSRSREEAGLEMELKKRTLASRKRILDGAFGEVLEHFRKLPTAAKKELYSAMMASVKGDIQAGKVRCLKGEECLFSGFGGFSKGEPISGVGGFILVSQDGSIEVDMRFEVLLKDIWDRNLSRVTALLFGDSP